MLIQGLQELMGENYSKVTILAELLEEVKMAIFDISWLSYYMPLFGFLFVFTIMYGVLAKTEILGNSMGVNLFIAFIFAGFAEPIATRFI